MAESLRARVLVVGGGPAGLAAASDPAPRHRGKERTHRQRLDVVRPCLVELDAEVVEREEPVKALDVGAVGPQSVRRVVALRLQMLEETIDEMPHESP